jgi:hypothetical protein
MTFQNYDLVKWSMKAGAWEVKACRPQERKYSIQLGTDFATREWANEALDNVQFLRFYIPSDNWPLAAGLGVCLGFRGFRRQLEKQKE